MQNNFQELLLTRLFGSGWVQAIYVAGMFAVLMWRKESVTKWRLFRLSYLLYGASLVLPPLILPLLTVAVQRPNISNDIFTYAIISAMEPILFASAVLCGLGSMMPRHNYARPVEMPPAKHPLD
jgi:hypothetical protein